MGIQQRLYAQAHCNPSRQKSLDNQYTNMISSFMLPRQTILPRPFHPANSFAPILLKSLAPLFASPVLCFQSFADSFAKMPGVGGYANTSEPRLASAVTCATWRLYPLWPQSIAHTSRHHGGVPLKRGLIVN